ncbi:MAG: hypothetical protein H7270_11640 [Dermatophilaceae bacterium]|nr:hypothetical protein [Dermatophilaceae bacterium]
MLSIRRVLIMSSSNILARPLVPMLVLAAVLLSACSVGSTGERGESTSKASACSTLVGTAGKGGAADEALALAAGGGNIPASDRDSAEAIQTTLLAIVSSGPAALQDPAGELVDLLVDPAAYSSGGSLSDDVQAAADTIREQCGGD